jgi:hypothetical protein
MRSSPLVRMTRSGSGIPSVSRREENSSSVISSGAIYPSAASAARRRAARTISLRPV